VARSALSQIAPALVVVALAVSCGSSERAADESTSAVVGQVLVGSCPAEGPGAPPCPTEPLGGVRLVVYDGNGDEVAQDESDGGGRFRMAVDPGSYTLVPQDPPPPALDIEKPIEFEVHAGSTTRLRVVLGTGVL
jgi:hypothetical protein